MQVSLGLPEGFKDKDWLEMIYPWRPQNILKNGNCTFSLILHDKSWPDQPELIDQLKQALIPCNILFYIKDNLTSLCVHAVWLLK